MISTVVIVIELLSLSIQHLILARELESNSEYDVLSSFNHLLSLAIKNILRSILQAGDFDLRDIRSK